MEIQKQSHHEQDNICMTRPPYRQGRKLTAVKVWTFLQVFTPCDESTHLLISNVPAIKLHSEFCALCSRFGDIIICLSVPNYEPEEQFAETFHVQYKRIQSARYAKKQLDGREFFGAVLHACYAPELETTDETREKLTTRRKEVSTRIKRKHIENVSNSGVNRNIGNLVQEYTTSLDNQNVENSTTMVKAHLTQLNTDETWSSTNIKVQSTSTRGSVSTHSEHVNCSSSIEPKNQQEEIQSLQRKLKFVPRSVAISKRINFHKQVS